jgi:autotransporter-associated beta strand protein
VLGFSAGGNGTYKLNGGLLSTGGISGGSGTGTFDFDGGTLKLTAATSTLLSGVGTINVQTGGAIINPNGFAVTIPQALMHDTTAGATAIDGGLTDNGAGTLTLSASNSYTGPTSVTAGTLAITGQINTPSSAFTVNGTGAAGTLGSAAVLTASNEYIGVSGPGSFTQSGGVNTISTNGHLYIGENGGSNGTYTLNAGLLKSPTTYVGYSGSGSFIQTGGTDSSTSLVMAANANGGVYTLSAGSIQTSSAIIGYSGAATFNQSGGTFSDTGSLILGRSASGNGVYNLSGGLLQSPAEDIGYSGPGTFVQTGGTNAATSTVLGFSTGGNGTYKLDGGVLSTAGISGGSGAGTFNFDGGTLQLTAATTTLLSGVGTINVQTGGAIINPNGFAVTIPQPLLHDTTSGAPATDGGLTQSGAGTLTLSASSTYTGPTTVNAGTLKIAGSVSDSESASVAANATLEVDGLFNNFATATVDGTFRGNGSVGAIDIGKGGTLAPGFNSGSADAGVMTANGNLMLTDASSVFSIRLGVATASDHDELTLDSGNVTLNGATLKLTLGSFYATQPAGTIDILINGTPADSTITGEFAQGTSITASNGDSFDIVYGENATDTGAGNDVLLVAVDPPEAAVTRNLVSQSFTFTTASVPEPGTFAMLAGGIAFLLAWRRANRRA